MTKVIKKSASTLLALALGLISVLALSMSVSAFDPYAEHGLCITEFALGEEGYTEEAGNANKYGWSAGWCAMFIGWCAEKAGILEIVPDKSSPQQYRNYYNNLGMYHAIDSSFDPQVGDLIFSAGTFSNPKHISIVIETTDENIITMDGNWGAEDEGRVAKVPRAKNDSTIVAYVRPNYTRDHNPISDIDENTHHIYCNICNYLFVQGNHFCYIQSDNSNHWEECGDCGYTRNEARHTWMVGNQNHLCEDCGLNAAHVYGEWFPSVTKHTKSCFCGRELSENHIFPTNTSPCRVCGYRPGDNIIAANGLKKTEVH